MPPRRHLVTLTLAGALCLGAGSASAQLADAVVRIKPSVVLVGTYRATDSPRFRYLGTGFVVGNGMRVVTNAHVVAQWSLAQSADLALLHIDGPAAPALALADSGQVREGDDLAFTGFPVGGLLGFSPVTHRATVSSITTLALPSPTGRQLSSSAIRSLRDGKIEVFQLDATAYPGNSGGPLFDPRSGSVVGVINMVLVKSTRESALSQPSGITYAIPGRHVLELMARNP